MFTSSYILVLKSGVIMIDFKMVIKIIGLLLILFSCGTMLSNLFLDKNFDFPMIIIISAIGILLVAIGTYVEF